MHGGREMRTKLPMETYWDDIVDREQVVKTKGCQRHLGRGASFKCRRSGGCDAEKEEQVDNCV